MKPIHLRIAGLHSYREPQEIDFSWVSELGVFGIFGSTGSGKSTILDAITLALYGEVERAQRGTQGILNHAEQSLTVSFTFELGSTDRKQWRIERKYLRDKKKDNAVYCRMARLVEMQGNGEQKLYEGEREVTRRIEEIIGLTVDDFTRAVVLPQGKFAEFLSLRGADRSEMLERIFDLEVYGNCLLKRLETHKGKVENRLQGLEAEQRALGDASEEAVATALSRLEETKTLETKRANALKQAQAEYDRLREIWGWQKELQNVAAQEAELSKQRDEIAIAEVELGAANRAKLVCPYLTEFEEACNNLTAVKERLKAAEEEFRRVSDATDQSQKAYDEARAFLEQREPELRTKKLDLERAKGIELKIAEWEKEKAESDKKIKECESVIANLRQKLDEDAKAKAEEELDKLRAQSRLKEINITPAYRQQVTEARLALEAWRRAEQALQQALKEREEKIREHNATYQDAQEAEKALLRTKEAVEALQRRFEETLKTQPDDEQTLTEQAQTLERTRAVVKRVEECESNLALAQAKLVEKEKGLKHTEKEADEANQQLAAAKAALEAAKQQLGHCETLLKEMERRNLAAYLAASLREDEPCPVCGATEHPQPATTSESAALESAEENLRISKSQVHDVQTAFDNAQKAEFEAQVKVKEHANLVIEARQDVQNKKQALERACMELPLEQQSLPSADLQKLMGQREADLLARRQAFSTWQTFKETLRCEFDKAREELSNAQIKKTAVDERLKAAQNAVVEAEIKLKEVTNESSKKRLELDEARGEIPLDRIEAEQKQIEEWDRERDKLNSVIEEREKRISELAVAIEKNRAAKEKEEKEGYVILTEQRNALQKQIDDNQDQVNAITGGQPAAKLLEAVEGELTQLKGAEEGARIALKEAAIQKEAKAQDYAAVQRELEIAKDRVNQATEKLTSALRDEKFPDAEQARQAVRSAKRREELSDKIETFRQEERKLANERQNLVAKLDERQITEEDWKACQKDLEEAQQTHQDAMLAKGAAEQNYEEICKKRQRWKEFEQELEQLKPLQNRLDLLQKIFKGRAFVKFVAEEQLASITYDASVRLGQLTKYRYALEVDSEGGFVIRDDGNGGVKRPVSSLSGGETFLASLALALALSAQIQLRGQHPLEFFFLDEGFGTLDPELLDVVITALERLRFERLTVGVITHVPELRTRLPRRLDVKPAEPGGRGTQIRIETI